MYYSEYIYKYLFVLIFQFNLTYCSIQCLNENGNPVDWYVVYKLPKIRHGSGFINDGTAYKYITSETLSGGWIDSHLPITSEQSLVARTLHPLYDKQNDDDIWLVYNDQEKWFSKESFGHTKGVMAANKNGGFWLIHSVPAFPSVAEKYSYPERGHRNGQSMLCITLPANQIDKLGKIFMYNKPNIFGKKISDNIKGIYPNLELAANGTTVKKAPWQMLSNIYSAAGRNFTNYAKSKKFNKDLYEWVADEFKTDIFAETWLNEVKPLPSKCDHYEVINVLSIEFKNNSKSSASVKFSSYKDHSKWAISKLATKPWICIGDINRAEHQEKRGGGTMCLEDKTLWEAYNNIINNTSSCKSYETKNHIAQ
ncbi:hypothetical protein O3M35_003424 [Rhynocoris fuscipes]|uniref:Uncharacterized protein n=1 Tax=Rhynocoris fuscipes TaxID=488301 RepID=A0AAW1CMW4_9HEMI